MDSFELSKIFGAVVAALLVMFGSQPLADFLVEGPKSEKPGYVVEISEDSGDHGEKTMTADASGMAADTANEAIDLTAGDAEKGEKVAKKCKACHTFEDGGKNKVGPNLHGIVSRNVAAIDGFKYSESLSSKGGTWTEEFLNCFLTKPSDCVPGTTMGFTGLKKPADRVNLIAYLKSLGG